ncbi:MAG: GyrI-like domain-containing protein [Cyclobacteriaceae bacterium]
METIAKKKFIGKRTIMSFSDNKTHALWSSFMPRRQEIQHAVGTNYYSIEVYAPSYFQHFNPDAKFEKWAAQEVKDFTSIPDGMETMTSPEGLYAVFIHKGPASAGPKTYQYIFGTWLPQAAFLLDDRPHFAVMGEQYKNDSPDSEEELWIPVRPK